MQKRFGFLRFTSFMLRLFAAICLLLGLAAGLGLILGGNYQNVLGFKLTIPTAALWIAAVLPVVCGLFYFFILYAAGGVLTLLIATEENTRATALGLANLRAPATSSPPAAKSPPAPAA